MVDDFVEFAVGHGPCARHKVEPSKTKTIHKARGLMCGIRPPLERCSIEWNLQASFPGHPATF